MVSDGKTESIANRLAAAIAADGQTIEQLVGQVDALLAELAPMQTRYKVSQRPDIRTIRYYTSEGLLPKPRYEGGRARYDGEHLLRLLVIKKMQAEHHTLRRIQAELLKANDSKLWQLLGLRAAPPPQQGKSATRPGDGIDIKGDAGILREAGTPLLASPVARADIQAGPLVRRVALCDGATLELDAGRLDDPRFKQALAHALSELARQLG